MYHILLTHSSIRGHLGCFHVLAIMDNAVLDIGVEISLQDPAFNYFVYTPRHLFIFALAPNNVSNLNNQTVKQTAHLG